MTTARTVRLDDKLAAAIKTAAETDERSVNGEIVWLLKVGLLVRKQARQEKYRAARWPDGVPDEELGQYLRAFPEPRRNPRRQLSVLLDPLSPADPPPGLEVTGENGPE